MRASADLRKDLRGMSEIFQHIEEALEIRVRVYLFKHGKEVCIWKREYINELSISGEYRANPGLH